MTGFYISNINKSFNITQTLSQYDERVNPTKSIREANDRLHISEGFENDTYLIWRRTNCKFTADKVFAEDAEHIIILEGVILNFTELKEKYNCNTMLDLCKNLIREKGEVFHDEFIGNFAGALYYKSEDTWIIYANKYSSKAVFYYCDKDKFAVAPTTSLIKDTLKSAEIGYNFNKDAAYLLMTYGYMGTNDTFIKEIKKLEAGEYLKIKSGRAEVIVYHRFNNHTYDLSSATEREIIDGLDLRFRRAIQREYNKDLEYGYTGHLRTLTAGMDSRSAAFVSHDLGFTNAINMTFGQPGSPDETIAREISRDLKNQIIFMSTTVENEDSKFLREIDKATFLNQGLGYYANLAASFNRFITVDNTCYGLLHNGNFSETVLTTYLKSPAPVPPAKPLHEDCSLLMHKTPTEHLNLYENEDIYTLYSMFFNKYLLIMSMGDVSHVYPTLDSDLVDYCLSVPLELRKSYNLYYKWLFSKYPQAEKYKLEKLNARFSHNRLRKWWGKITRYGSIAQYFRCSKDPLPTRIRNRFKLHLRMKPSPIALFPFDYWYATDKESREYMDNYFKNNLNHPAIDEELKADLLYVYENSTARPKSMAITVLAAAKLFFD